MKKSDIQRSYHQGSQGLPMVNVKVSVPYSTAQWDDLATKIRNDNADDSTAFDGEYIERVLDEDETGDWFNMACEVAWEHLQGDADNLWGGMDRYRGVEVYSEGRSGKWAVVKGLPDVDEWDAIAIGQWSRFAKWAREQADDVPYLMADLIYFNHYVRDIEEAEERAAAARMEIATVPA